MQDPVITGLDVSRLRLAILTEQTRCLFGPHGCNKGLKVAGKTCRVDRKPRF